MIVPLNWLKEYIDISETPEEIAKAFTSIGYMLDRPITEIKGDSVLDLEVRQNRSDCLSLIGLARELGAVLKRPIKLPESSERLGETVGKTQIDIPEPELCPRFFGLTIENISVKESPDWMKQRLETYGIKSINNIVDITNYVATELGMPLHAYDADKVADRHIIIRHAQKGETLVLFGGKTVTFVEDDIVHADPTGVIGFGGLMGGEEKSVHPDTTSVILEAAIYNQASIRRSSRRHDIRTEASTRLEKFIHPHLVEVALKRALHLVQELAGGILVDSTDAFPLPMEQKSVALDVKEVARLGGIDVSLDEASAILDRLQIENTQKSDSELLAVIPYFRTDIEQEADLVEEIIRMYGYDKIPEHLPQSAPPRSIQSKMFDHEEAARDQLVGMGYDEVITEPLTDETNSTLKPIILENSLTSEKRMLRTSLKNSLVDALLQRSKYRQDDIRLFEVGKIYYKDGQEFKEERVVGLITSGPHTYLDIKGDSELFHNRIGYVYDDKNVEIVPLSETSFFACIHLEKVVEQGKMYASVLLSSPNQYIFHDFAVVIDTQAPVNALLEDIKNLDELIYKTQYISTQDIGKESKKEVLVRVSYASIDASLSEKDVQPVREKILEYMKKMEG